MLALWMMNMTQWGAQTTSASLAEPLMEPAPLGQQFVSAANLSGPTSYTQGSAPKLYARQFGMLNIRIAFAEGMSASGTYFVRIQQLTTKGTTVATVRWFVVSSGLEVPNGTNLSAESVRILAVGN